MSKLQTTLRQDPLHSALTTHTIRDFCPIKRFKDNELPLTSLDFSPTVTTNDSSLCITTSQDESLRIYDCQKGQPQGKPLYSKKYGCNLAQFTWQPGKVAYASTKQNDTIRYLSYATNQYVRYFIGHKEQVTSLQRCPQKSNTMVSAAQDGMVNVWDLESSKPVCSVRAEGGREVVAAFDPSGRVVGVVAGDRIMLYDWREMDRGPFKSVGLGNGLSVSGIKFIPPLGNHILVSYDMGQYLVLDSFTLEPVLTLGESTGIDGRNDRWWGQNVTTTPDGQIVMAGSRSASGGVVFWDIGQRLIEGSRTEVVVEPNGRWNSGQEGPVGICAFNPQLMECVTGTANTLTMWSASF